MERGRSLKEKRGQELYLGERGLKRNLGEGGKREMGYKVEGRRS